LKEDELDDSNVANMSSLSCSHHVDVSFELFGNTFDLLRLQSPVIIENISINGTTPIIPKRQRSRVSRRGCTIKSKSFSNANDYDFNEQVIKQALERINEKPTFLSEHQNDNDSTFNSTRLIGDMSRKHILPILNASKHNDLASISSDTVKNQDNFNYFHFVIDSNWGIYLCFSWLMFLTANMTNKSEPFIYLMPDTLTSLKEAIYRAL
jgi:hypothetical protein